MKPDEAATGLLLLSWAARRLRRGEVPVLSQWPLSITVALLFTVIGLVGLWELLRQ